MGGTFEMLSLFFHLFFCFSFPFFSPQLFLFPLNRVGTVFTETCAPSSIIHYQHYSMSLLHLPQPEPSKMTRPKRKKIFTGTLHLPRLFFFLIRGPDKSQKERIKYHPLQSKRIQCFYPFRPLDFLISSSSLFSSCTFLPISPSCARSCLLPFSFSLFFLRERERSHHPVLSNPFQIPRILGGIAGSIHMIRPPRGEEWAGR